jgi:hypothetical protein
MTSASCCEVSQRQGEDQPPRPAVAATREKPAGGVWAARLAMFQGNRVPVPGAAPAHRAVPNPQRPAAQPPADRPNPPGTAASGQQSETRGEDSRTRQDDAVPSPERARRNTVSGNVAIFAALRPMPMRPGRRDPEAERAEGENPSEETEGRRLQGESPERDNIVNSLPESFPVARHARASTVRRPTALSDNF